MPKERNKADGYREKAYEGDTKAMNNLGVCYERGTGVKVSLELAFEWYMRAAATWGGPATGINRVVVSQGDKSSAPVIYDLQGRRVKNVRGGLYIIDKKIVYLQPKS
ncbi:SEL1-like repeat protein [Prevotella sp. P6B4]|uniref:SEL1-like repeat protein n=1 Tax=Prevotella sp. P6B4 TaxID=1410614 RepID=UPI00048E696D|nr:SEL1-like repeat protein [Prevotella sp. P6B4]